MNGSLVEGDGSTGRRWIDGLSGDKIGFFVLFMTAVLAMISSTILRIVDALVAGDAIEGKSILLGARFRQT